MGIATVSAVVRMVSNPGGDLTHGRTTVSEDRCGIPLLGDFEHKNILYTSFQGVAYISALTKIAICPATVLGEKLILEIVYIVISSTFGFQFLKSKKHINICYDVSYSNSR